MDFPGQDGLRRCRAELYGDRPCSPSTLTLQGKGQEELSISEARDTEEGDRHSGLPGSISPKLALMAPFQHLSRPAVQSQSPSLAKGTDPAATGVCCPVPHTWAVWGAEVQCPLPTQVPGLCLGTQWLFCNCPCRRTIPSEGKSSFQPSTSISLGDMQLARRREGQVPPGMQQEVWGWGDTIRFSNPSLDFSCGLTLPCALRNVSSVPSATSTTELRLHSAPPSPWHLPSHDGADQGGESSQSRGDPPADSRTPTLWADPWVWRYPP